MMTIYSGWIGAEEQAANIILFQTWFLLFMNSFGITFSATSLVGNSLGANKPKSARRYTHAALVFGFSVISVLIFAHWYFKDPIIRAFTTDEKVTQLIMDVFSLYLFALYLDCGQGLCGGMIRAIGYQKFASIVQF